jgi:hypothetical protein
MFRIIGKILSWLGGTTWKLLLLAGAILLIWGTLAPVGTLVWWVNQDLELISDRKNRFKNLPSSKATNSDTDSASIDCYIRASQQGRYIAKISGPHDHDGTTGYFGQKTVPGKNYTYLDLTLQKIDRLPIW